MNQELANVINNAIKYTLDGGQVAVKVSFNEAKLIILIQDNGNGVADEDLERN